MTIELGYNPDSGGRTMMLHSTESGRFLPCTRGEVQELLRAAKLGDLDGLFTTPPQASSASAAAPARPGYRASDRRWFTDEEFAAVQATYQALTRVGNASAVRELNWLWDPLLDRVHQGLGALLAMMTAQPELDKLAGGVGNATGDGR